jgi:hypothetical protein
MAGICSAYAINQWQACALQLLNGDARFLEGKNHPQSGRQRERFFREAGFGLRGWMYRFARCHLTKAMHFCCA